MFIEKLAGLLPGQISPKFIDYLEEINQHFIDINELIDAYNKADSDRRKVKLLRKIYDRYQLLVYTYPQNVVSSSPYYQTMVNDQLMRGIQRECLDLGIPSLRTLYNPDPRVPIDDPSSLAEIVANMDPTKAVNLLEILISGPQFDIHRLAALYQPLEPGYNEFQAFLNSHSIQFIGGGNSQNFVVTSQIDGSSQILKVENRMRAPKLAEQQLREDSLHDVMSKVFAERQVSCELNDHSVITRNLIVSEYISYGNLEQYSINRPDIQARMNTAIDLFSQMTEILIDITYLDTCFFPDMKITNWMVDENKRLRIADGKSFLFASNADVSEKISYVNKDESFICSLHMLSPEFRFLTKHEYDVDKMHAYMLGKALYQYLTLCSENELIRIEHSSQFNFDLPVFHTQQGKSMIFLINHLVRTHPNHRMSLEDVKIRLEVMKRQDFCRSILLDIESYAINGNDANMQYFINFANDVINNLQTIDSCQRQEDDLLTILSCLENAQEDINRIKQTIEMYRTNSSTFQENTEHIADYIERALLSVPLSMRQHIMQSGESDPGYKVLCALNYPESLLIGRPPDEDIEMVDTGKVTEEESAPESLSPSCRVRFNRAFFNGARNSPNIHPGVRQNMRPG